MTNHSARNDSNINFNVTSHIVILRSMEKHLIADIRTSSGLLIDIEFMVILMCSM